MNNRFLISSSAVTQSIGANSDEFGGDGPGVTRRSFIKRTGGATVATLVAMNMLTFKAKADGAGDSGNASGESKKYGLVCMSEPTLGTYKDACPNSWFDAHQFEIPYGQDVDYFGYTVKYYLVHWIEFGDHPKSRDRKPLHSSMTTQCNALAAIVMGFYHYENLTYDIRGGAYNFSYSSKKWVYKTIMNLSVEPDDQLMRASTQGAEDASATIVYTTVKAGSNNSGATPLYASRNNDLIGWVIVSQGSKEGTCNFESAAVFVPKSYVSSSSTSGSANLEWGGSENISYPHVNVGVSYGQTLSINQQPPGPTINLNWQFGIRKMSDDLSDLPDPVVWSGTGPKMPTSAYSPFYGTV